MNRRLAAASLIVVAVLLVIAMPLMLDSGEKKPDEPVAPIVERKTQFVPLPPDPPKIEILPKPEIVKKERRMPIGGSESVIVIGQDGSAYLETDGVRSKFLGPLPPPAPKPEVLPKPKETPRALGQLVVTDKGVIDVPVDAIITYLGEDHVVTHDQVGNSVVYYVDGRVDKRDRTTPKK